MGHLAHEQQVICARVVPMPGRISSLCPIAFMQTIRVDPKTGAMTAGGDPTRTGYAMGY